MYNRRWFNVADPPWIELDALRIYLRHTKSLDLVTVVDWSHPPDVVTHAWLRCDRPSVMRRFLASFGIDSTGVGCGQYEAGYDVQGCEACVSALRRAFPYVSTRWVVRQNG